MVPQQEKRQRKNGSHKTRLWLSRSWCDTSWLESSDQGSRRAFRHCCLREYRSARAVASIPEKFDSFCKP